MKKILGIIVLLVALASCSPKHIEIGEYQVVDTLDVRYDLLGKDEVYVIVIQLEDSSLHYGNMDIFGNVKNLNPKPITNLKRVE